MSDSPIPSAVASKLETVATVSALFGEGMTVARMNGYRARKCDALVLRSDAESAIALAEKRARDLIALILHVTGEEDKEGLMPYAPREALLKLRDAAIRSITSNTGG